MWSTVVLPVNEFVPFFQLLSTWDKSVDYDRYLRIKVESLLLTWQWNKRNIVLNISCIFYLFIFHINRSRKLKE